MQTIPPGNMFPNKELPSNPFMIETKKKKKKKKWLIWNIEQSESDIYSRCILFY